jgi:hypothetical protein
MVTSLFALHYTVKTSNDFHFYMLNFGRNALKQKTVHSSVAYYVHVLLHSTERKMFHYINNLLVLKLEPSGI